MDLSALRGVWPVKEGRDLQDCFAFGTADGGLPEVLAIQPFSCERWYRFDDAIDWITESYLIPGEGVRVPFRKDQVSHAAVLPDGPHPFNGAFMDARDGRRLPDKLVIPWLWAGRDKAVPGSEHMHRALEAFACEMGFASQEEAKANVAPEVPEEIRHLAEFAGLFTGPEVWLQLRPLLYTYWM
jgi:hypothetical protein